MRHWETWEAKAIDEVPHLFRVLTATRLRAGPVTVSGPGPDTRVLDCPQRHWTAPRPTPAGPTAEPAAPRETGAGHRPARSRLAPHRTGVAGTGTRPRGQAPEPTVPYRRRHHVPRP